MFNKSPATPAKTQRYPEYSLIPPLPSTELPTLLGRIVASKESPTDDYKPSDPRPALAHHNTILEVTDRDFSSLFWAAANRSAEAKLCSILNLDVSKDADRQRSFAAKFVRTRMLPQHRDALKALLERHRKEVVELLVENGGVGWMVVGVKSCIDGSSGARIVDSGTRSVKVDLPVSTAVAAATHGTVTVGTAVDVSAGVGAGHSRGGDVTSTMVGEQVFAVRYRRLTLKKAFLSSKGAFVDYGQIERAHFDSGVFDRAKAEEIEEDDEDVEEEGVEGDFEDEDVGLGEEGGGLAMGEGREEVLVDRLDEGEDRDGE